MASGYHGGSSIFFQEVFDVFVDLFLDWHVRSPESGVDSTVLAKKIYFLEVGVFELVLPIGGASEGSDYLVGEGSEADIAVDFSFGLVDEEYISKGVIFGDFAGPVGKTWLAAECCSCETGVLMRGCNVEIRCDAFLLVEEEGGGGEGEDEG